MKKPFNWEQLMEWEKKYFLNPLLTAEEVPIARKIAEKVDQHFIYLSDGTKLLDMVGGYYSCNVGLKHPKISQAIREATEDFGFVGEVCFANPYTPIAAKILVEDILGPDKWCGGVRFVSTGSEAVEMALQVAKLYTNRPNIITRQWAYHGWTLGSGACSRLRSVARYLSSATEPGYQPLPGADVPGVFVVPGHNCYRCSLGHKYPDCKNKGDGTLPCVSLTESMILSIGAETVAAMITEIAYGASNIAPAPEYYPQLVKMLKKYGILWIDDEVICGFGRLGAWFGYQKYGGGAKPDIMTMAKGLISSQLPAGGVAVSKEIAQLLNTHRWTSVPTFSEHPVVMAAVIANLEVLIEEKVIENSAKIGEYIGKKLAELQEKHKCIGYFSGSGCLWNVELVKNKAKQEPFVAEDRGAILGHNIANWPVNIVGAKALEKGVLFEGFQPNCMNISPNCTITPELVDIAMDALDYGLTELDKMCD